MHIRPRGWCGFDKIGSVRALYWLSVCNTSFVLFVMFVRGGAKAPEWSLRWSLFDSAVHCDAICSDFGGGAGGSCFHILCLDWD